jgi:DNA-binding NarL/FixJ family response regulator
VLIRILLLHVPGLIRAVLAEAFAAEPDMQLVDAAGAADDALAHADPDVVIVGLEAGEPPLVCLETLRRLPHVKVLALEGQGREVSMYELRPTRTMLGPLSPSDVVASVRRALRPMGVVTRATNDATDAQEMELTMSLARERTRP